MLAIDVLLTENQLAEDFVAARCPAAPTGPLEVVGLGAGQGDKDLLVLQALQSSGRPLRYRPVDSSQALLEIAVARARQSGFEGRGLKADLEDAETVETLS